MFLSKNEFYDEKVLWGTVSEGMGRLATVITLVVFFLLFLRECVCGALFRLVSL